MQINIALAEMVREGDPDRFTATMAAPVAARGPLFAVAALNLEWARVSTISDNPLIVAMRLQWWRDIVDARTPPSGEAATAMVELLETGRADPAVLHRMIDARGQDMDFATPQDLQHYLEATAGCLSQTAALATGAFAQWPGQAQMRAIGTATGLANWLRAAPRLGQAWVPQGGDLQAMVTAALADLHLRKQLPQAAFAASLWSFYAKGILQRARGNPGRVEAGDLQPPEITRRAGLLWRAMRGRW